MRTLSLKQNTSVTMTPIIAYVGYETLILDWYNKPRLWEYFRQYPPLLTWNSPTQMQQLFAHHYLVLRNGQPVGMCGIFMNEAHSKRVEFSLLVDLADKNHRRDVSSSVVDQIQDYVFGYLDYHKIVFKLLEGRGKLAKAVCEQKGFKLEGVRKDDTLYRGKFLDEHYYTKFKETK